LTFLGRHNGERTAGNFLSAEFDFDIVSTDGSWRVKDVKGSVSVVEDIDVQIGTGSAADSASDGAFAGLRGVDVDGVVVADKDGGFRAIAGNLAFVGIAGGANIDGEWGAFHVIAAILDSDVVFAQLFRFVSHVVSHVAVVVDDGFQHVALRILDGDAEFSDAGVFGVHVEFRGQSGADSFGFHAWA